MVPCLEKIKGRKGREGKLQLSLYCTKARETWDQSLRFHETVQKANRTSIKVTLRNIAVCVIIHSEENKRKKHNEL